MRCVGEEWGSDGKGVIADLRLAGTALRAGNDLRFMLNWNGLQCIVRLYEMIRLEDLKPGVRVCGLVPDQVVEVITAKSLGDRGSDTFRVIVRYEDDYDVSGKQTLDRTVEERLIEAKDTWALDRDAELGLLAVEARRIRDAHLFDFYHAAFSSEIEPLPHQIEAVYGWMLGRHPLRVLLADDPGAGKTIMAGLLIKEMMARDVVRRCLIVVPGNLSEQWKIELREKLRIGFDIITNKDIENENPFLTHNQLIVSMDRAKRAEYKELLKQSEWDLIICDEAHKMSVSFAGNKVSNITERYRLGQTLGEISTNYLLITATPHTGKREEFRWSMQLLDEDRFAIPTRQNNVSDLYLRRMKEQLVTRELKPLFPKRLSYTAKYDLSHQELDLYRAVTAYCREEFNRAERYQGGRKNTVGFALTILQRRLASSPEAIYQTLRSRRKRLTAQLNESYASLSNSYRDIDWEELEDLPAAEREDLEIEIANLATAARSIPELEKEITTLRRLEAQADVVRKSNRDSKWEKLREIWDKRLPEMEKDGNPRKLIIFTEHRATISYLVQKLGNLLGNPGAIARIDGSVPPNQRRIVQDSFRDNPKIQILVATDAAGEGINLQFAHLMVNYDLPWNPNRLEQRFGRIHRIGQKEVCHLFNLVIGNTREDAVYRLLAEKLEIIGNDLNGLVFDVLGELFYEIPLRVLVRESLQYGDDPKRQKEIEQRVDSVFDLDNIKELENRRISDRAKFDANRTLADMEKAGAGRLQTRDTKIFLSRVFDYFDLGYKSRVGGEMRKRENSRYEITNVPGVITEYADTNGLSRVKKSYRSVCFDPNAVQQSNGYIVAELIHPEHPLLQATIGWVLSHWQTNSNECGEALPVLVDECNELDAVRMVCQVEWAIRNSFQRGQDSKQALSLEAHFIEIDGKNTFRIIGPAPNLDYRPASAKDIACLHTHLEDDWLSPEASDDFIQTEVSEKIVAPRLVTIKEREFKRIDIERKEVIRSLNSQIAHENRQEIRFRQLEEAYPSVDTYRASAARHKQNRMRLEARKMHRERRWKLEEQITPSGTTIRRVAVIVPASLLHD